MKNRGKFKTLFTLHEGKRNKVYKDTKGIATLGVGHNIRDVPISDKVIDLILEEDIDNHLEELCRTYPWFEDMDDVRQGALLDLFMNMGGPVIAQFKNTLAAMRVGNWEAAALGLENSAWFTQVGTRGPRIVKMFRDGRWPV